MKEQTKEAFTKRESLCGEARFRPRKAVDMEAVYKDLDSGMTVKAVADKYEVSESTLRRRHSAYQKELKDKKKEDGYKLPPLPTGI